MRRRILIDRTNRRELNLDNTILAVRRVDIFEVILSPSSLERWVVTLDQTNSPRPSTDTALDVLANTYRRRLLVALLERDPQDGGALQIPAAVEPAPNKRESVRIAMAHSHLPKLENAGFIEWDRGNNSVRTGPAFDAIRPLLARMQDRADRISDQ